MYCNRNCSAKASYRRRKAGQPVPPRWQHPALYADNPLIRVAASRAVQFGEAHDWSTSTTRCVLDGLVTVLEERPAGDRVPLTEVRSRPHRHVSRPRLAEVLDDLDLLDSDTTPAARSWIDHATEDLAPGFIEPVRRWLIALLEGDSRSKPRTAAAVYSYLGSVRPHLQRWATEHDHLREVTRTDIHTTLGDLRGHRRHNTAIAVRSLFRFARKHGLVFTNPTIGLKSGPATPNLIPMTDSEIHAVEQLAEQPAHRLIVALAAEHAARTGTIRDLTLDDIDLPNRRITLDAHNQRLGDLTQHTVRAWLEHRRATWPNTPNRHVIISAKTALGTGPVGKPFIRFQLGRNGFSLDRIRADRVLHEATTTGADPLHLSLVFNISHTTAIRYTSAAGHLLNNELETTEH
jgi:integrase